jgi:hypothetical protein
MNRVIELCQFFEKTLVKLVSSSYILVFQFVACQ